jgi:prevent-host-death family protein
MTQINLTTPHDDLADAIEQVRDGNPIVLEVQGKPVAALVSLADLQRVEEHLENLRDAEAAERASREFHESGEAAIPLEDLARELNIALPGMTSE